MADKRLVTYTTVTNPENGQTETLPPGTPESEIPEWATIDNESAWLEPEAPENPSDVPVQHTGDYADMSVQELLDVARERNIHGVSNAKKSELIEKLEAADRAG